jgi:hypothetical protein
MEPAMTALPDETQMHRPLPGAAALARAVTPLAPFAVGGLLYVVMLLNGGQLLNDADSYWHVAVGKWIVAHWALPTHDTFSFTFAGAPWIAKEWLSQLLYAGAHALAGWPGMVVLATATIALAFALQVRFLIGELRPPYAILFAAGAFLLAAPHVVARPHALAFPVMVAWVAALVRALDERRAPTLWLLPLMVLWANLHGGFTFGIMMVGALGLDAIASAPAEARLRTAGQWIGFGLLALAAGCATPYGWQSMLMTVKVLGLGPALSVIGEWKPADFTRLGGLEIVILVGIGAALWRGVTLPPVRILIVLGLLHMTLSAARNAEIFGLIAPLVIARPLASQIAAIRAAPSTLRPRAAAAATALLVAVLVPVSLALAAALNYAPDDSITPAAAVAALKEAHVDRVFNDYNFGGYLVYEGVPTFIDGRTELFGTAFVERYYGAVTLSDLPDFERLLKQYDIQATLLSPDDAATTYLDRLPGWHRLYADGVAVVHVRN